MDDLWTEQQFHEMLVARKMLAAADFPSISSVLVCSSVGIAVQALLTGSCLQMVRMYFRTRKDDPMLAKLAVCWIIFVLVLCVALANLQQGMVVSFMERFTAWQYQDFWVYQLQILLNSTIFAPTLAFFVRRAYYIWNRNRTVFIVGNVLVVLSFVVNITACSIGLRTPAGGFDPLTNDQYAAAIPPFVAMLVAFAQMKVASETIQLVTTGSLCFLTCYGIYRHRNGYKTFDTAVSRIAFISGESLLPMFALNIASLTLVLVGRQTSNSILLLRPLVSLSPAIYAHALLTALTSRERVREILQAEPVRDMVPYSGSPIAEKDIESGNGGTGSEKLADPIVVLVDSQISRERRKRNWPNIDKATKSAGSQAGMLQSRSHTTAPLSPSSGTSTTLTTAMIAPADSENQAQLGSPKAPVSPLRRPSTVQEQSDPLMRNGAIVRPPLSPGLPADLISGWQREQAAVRQALRANSAAARGDKAWSSSAGQVPMPSSPTLPRSPGSAASNDHDDGLDIFEVLLHGPSSDDRPNMA